MGFQLIRGTGNTAVIRGEDKFGVSGAQIVDTTIYDRYIGTLQVVDQAAAADEAIEEFFAPLLDALDDIVEGNEVEDPLDPVKVISEGEVHTHGVSAVTVTLDHDGQLVQAVLGGYDDRLSWVDRVLFIEALVQPEPAVDEDDVIATSLD